MISARQPNRTTIDRPGGADQSWYEAANSPLGLLESHQGQMTSLAIISLECTKPECLFNGRPPSFPQQSVTLAQHGLPECLFNGRPPSLTTRAASLYCEGTWSPHGTAISAKPGGLFHRPFRDDQSETPGRRGPSVQREGPVTRQDHRRDLDHGEDQGHPDRQDGRSGSAGERRGQAVLRGPGRSRVADGHGTGASRRVPEGPGSVR